MAVGPCSRLWGLVHADAATQRGHGTGRTGDPRAAQGRPPPLALPMGGGAVRCGFAPVPQQPSHDTDTVACCPGACPRAKGACWACVGGLSAPNHGQPQRSSSLIRVYPNLILIAGGLSAPASQATLHARLRFCRRCRVGLSPRRGTSVVPRRGPCAVERRFGVSPRRGTRSVLLSVRLSPVCAGVAL